MFGFAFTENKMLVLFTWRIRHRRLVFCGTFVWKGGSHGSSLGDQRSGFGGHVLLTLQSVQILRVLQPRTQHDPHHRLPGCPVDALAWCRRPQFV